MIKIHGDTSQLHFIFTSDLISSSKMIVAFGARMRPIEICNDIDSIDRGDWIRTSGPCLPKAVLYQAELHPDYPYGQSPYCYCA